MQIEDFADREAGIQAGRILPGPQISAWGLFQDRFGNIRRQFVVDINGTHRR